MSKSSVLELASALANAQAGATNLDQFYDDMTQDVARGALFNVLEIVEADAGIGTYTKPERISSILGIFFDDTMLSLTTLRELEATTPDWRARIGRPVAWLIEDLSHEVFQVVPAPVTTGDPVVPVFGAPFGLDYPANTLAVLGSEVRRDMPDYMDLPLALVLLGREFSHPSPHQDRAFAGACKTLGALLLSMVS